MLFRVLAVFEDLDLLSLETILVKLNCGDLYASEA